MKLIISTFLISFFLQSTAFSKGKVVIYADAKFPPYSYVKDGKADGIYGRILSTAFSRLNDYEVEIVPTAWKRALNLVRKGRAFAFYPPYRREKERPYVFPYSIPILKEEVVVVCRSDLFKKQRLKAWPEDFIGLSIGVNLGFEIFSSRFWKLAAKGQLNAEEAVDTITNLKKMFKGRIDCYGNDRAAIFSEFAKLRNNPEHKNLHENDLHVAKIISAEYGHIGYARDENKRYPYKADFIKKTDAILQEMISSGEIQRIYDQYLENE